jgi:perosamine synthetase
MFNRIVSFIQDLYPGREIIPLHEPCFRGNEKRYLEECIDSTYVSSIGKFVEEFEKKVEEYLGATRAVVTVNGTEALHLALILAGVREADEVITQPLTFVATANSILYCRAVPVFVDVDKDTLGLSPVSLGLFLKENARVVSNRCINIKTGRTIKACIPVHTFGHPCRIDEILELCKEWEIEVIEDAAESIGSKFKGRATGTFGKIGVLSFNGNKTITTGGGGMILTNDEDLASRAKHLTTQAKAYHPWEYYHDVMGYNLRMPNLNAALGVAQIEQLDYFIELKRKLAERYKSFFTDSGIGFFCEPENSRSNYWLNSIMLGSRAERDEFLEFTNKKGIKTRPAWHLLNNLPMFKECQVYNIPNAEWAEAHLVNLPSFVNEKN